VDPRHNTDPDFVGLPTLKREQLATLLRFREWAASGRWIAFHSAHYDWWMFPTDEPSGYGFAYTVYEGEVAALRADGDYLRHYLEGANLLALSWGWDLGAAAPLAGPEPDQRWQDWPIRLYKATRSLRLFGCDREFHSFRSYGRRLLEGGASFEYHRDLSGLFLERD